MIEKNFLNHYGNEVNYLKWEIDNPKAILVIAHGMAEHPNRYDAVAKFFNEHGIVVYAIYHIGHGKHASILGHMAKGDYNKCVSNINELITMAINKYNLPCFLLGHSMGSFMSQLYIERYHNIKGVILSGSSIATSIMKLGYSLTSLICLFSKDSSKPSKFMNKVSFGSYNKIYDKVETPFDWLTRDSKTVKEYVDDPLCGFVCSKSFFREMTGSFKEMAKVKNIKQIDKDLPILIEGGSMDPVSSKAKGLYALEKQYKKCGINNVKLICYDGGRHEIFNEINKEEVYNNTLKFIEDNL